MILLLIVLLFLIKIGLKITLVGMKVSSYVYDRYKRIQSHMSNNNGVEKTSNNDTIDAMINTSKKVIKTTGKIAKKVIMKGIEWSVWLADKVTSLLITLLSSVGIYVIILDAVVMLFLVSIAGFYMTNMMGDDDGGYTAHVYWSDEDAGGGGNEDDGGGGNGGGSDIITPPSGDEYQAVYDLLCANGYSGKAQALASVYVEAKAKWGRDVAIGLMANINHEGSPGKIEGINFASAFANGKIDASRKVTLSCGCSKSGTVTIDYWAQAPCSAHEQAGKVISNKGMVTDMLQVSGSTPGIGVGSCQWSGGRRVGILNKYNSLSDFSANSLLLADVSFIMDELSGSYSGVINNCSGKSASECAKIICGEYEKPASMEAAKTTRAATASDLDTKLASIGK